MSQSVKVSKILKKPILLDIVEDNEIICNDIYPIAHKPFANSEFIPINMIPIVMKHFFESSELVLLYNDSHAVYKILIRDLLASPLKNWEHNRPPDMARCPDIARYIYQSRKPIDTMLHISFNNLKQVFEVIDGIHRITALNIIKEENSKPLDLLEQHEFGSGNDANWLYDQHLLVNVRFNASVGELIEAFKNLNKSQPVPELYIKDHAKEKRTIIDTTANDWFVKYKKHFSSSANPNTGNTNRNKFVELLDKIYDKYNIDETNVDKLRRLLNEANAKLAMNIPIDTSVNVRVKCRESGCYLFLLKNDKLEEFI